MATILAFFTLSLSLLLLPASGSPPGPVVKCTSDQTNAYPAFTYPTNEQELFLAVSKASLAKQHMEAVSTYDHSIPKLLCPGGLSGSPPGPVVKCTSGQTNCTVTNAYGAFPDRSTCRVAAVTYPTNEQELLLAVSNASLAKQHMKAVSTYAHSIPKLSCPGGLSGAGLAISTERLNKSVHVDVASSRLTVEAGITLRALLDVAAANGLALPNSPYWQGVTLGGLLGTGSHGSSVLGKGSAVHEYVVGMRLVVPSPVQIDGLYSRIVILEEDDPDLLAAKVSLGVLGVVSQVRLTVPIY